MNILEMLFNITITREIQKDVNYDFWSITNENEFMLMSMKKTIDNINNVELNKYDLMERLFNNACDVDDGYLISQEDVQKYSSIEIEFECDVDNVSTQKYPLVCVRGECNHQCKCNSRFYCFRDTPCFQGRPDLNCWSAKYPEFMNLLFDVVEWVNNCDVTDALVVMFQYTPTYYEPELSYGYATAIQVNGKKLKVVKDIKTKYKEYNKKYPTNDRKIEESINTTYFGDSVERFRF